MLLKTINRQKEEIEGFALMMVFYRNKISFDGFDLQKRVDEKCQHNFLIQRLDKYRKNLIQYCQNFFLFISTVKNDFSFLLFCDEKLSFLFRGFY
jgi:hypothetical protein